MIFIEHHCTLYEKYINLILRQTELLNWHDCFNSFGLNILKVLQRIFKILNVDRHLFSDNLALRKSAWQSSTYLGYGANKAVDGSYTKLYATGGQCSISGNNKDTAEWRVNLGNIFSIHHIFIQYRTEKLIWSM